MLPPFEPVTLPTRRLTLRCLTAADSPALFAIFSHPDVMRYWSWPAWTDPAQAQEFVSESLEGYRARSGLQFALERRTDSCLVGTCALFHFHFTSRRAEVGYALGRPFWGQGYMHEALTGLIEYAFGPLDLNRLEADIDPRNDASARALKRLGFQREGLLRERWIVSGEIQDTALYGLLRRDWEQRAAASAREGA